MREFRIALVCYGGVSLAVYMHGVVKEIHKLVRASAAYDLFREGKIKANPFSPETDTEYAYWDVIDRLEKYQPIRVIVDVISGASAGGINAVFLGKAIAHNASQEHLRDLWLKHASIQELTTETHETVPWYVRLITPAISRITGLKRLFPEFQNAYGHLMAFTFHAAVRRAVAPPFDGDRMLGWLYEGLARMKPPAHQDAPLPDTLVPENQALDLFATVTDFYGYPSFMPVHDPAGRGVHDQKYRHVMRFSYDNRNIIRDDFVRTAELAFAARATSSLPGGFSPVQIGDLKRVLEDRLATDGEPPVDEEGFLARQFREYDLAGANARLTCFADGGILDNQPFSNAIRAIAKRSANREVVRRILYIDPHPISEPAPADGRLPGTFETLLGSLSRIPKHEPVHDELWMLNAFNRRVQRINDAVESSRSIVDKLVAEVGALYELDMKADLQTLEDWRHAVNRHAAGLETAGYASYVGFKLRSMVDELRDAICRELNYPALSGHALFVGNVLMTWMERRRTLPVGDRVTDDQTQFLKLFDIGFRRRRVRFLIKDINAMYKDARLPGRRPGVAELDEMKRALYDLLATYQSNLLGGEQRASLLPLMKAAFGEEVITPRIQSGRVDADEFLDELGDRVDAYYAALRNAIWDDKTPLHLLLSSIVATCADWDEGPRTEFLTRFIGFPFWDIMIFPLSDMGDVGELYEIRGVRMSPNDARLIIDGGAEKKLRGVRYQHFGAFFSRYARENDYLWGRLDAAERLIDILVDATLEQTEHSLEPEAFLAEKTLALDAVLNDEEGTLTVVASRIAALRKLLRRNKAPHCD